MNQLDSIYNPKKSERKIYRMWEKQGYFNPDKLPVSKSRLSAKGNKLKNKSFCIIMPPPNANGSLHLGHAVFVTLQDIMIRYHRMKGDKTLWLPGADHAGFETQSVYEKKLEKEGRNRFQIPAKQLWREMWNFTQTNKKAMENQLRQLGASCDWSRKKFTLDPDIISKTQDTFIQMHKQGLVYREKKLVNWCIKHQTTLSDIETNSVKRKDPLYYIKYGPIIVATVRPETIFGDTAVAVNPKDKRYKNLVGKEIEIDVVLGKLKLKVIADDFVDPEFGTGAVKITPAHDLNDFEFWQRHKDEIGEPREVINQFGKMTLIKYFSDSDEVKEFEGLKINEARELIVEKLKRKGLIEKIDSSYNHLVTICYRCQNILEPRLLSQWFVKVKPLADKAIEVVKRGKIKFIPARFNKIYFHWMKNIRDWNISRQIVWGIPIPAWFCGCGEIIIQKEKPKRCDKCLGRKRIKRDPDVFDTWFSSGQWPFFALGFGSAKKPKNLKTKSDYEIYYPTDVMETGWDILFFWVARMIMLGLYKTKKIPFKFVYLHGLVRDKDRQKMSKSKGNTIDPLGVVDLYGADALRMALVFGTGPGNDIIISEEKIISHRRFCNKIWNAARFIFQNIGENTNFLEFDRKKLSFTKEDRQILSELGKTIKIVNQAFRKFNFHQAAEKTYTFFWHKFCDKTIEDVKKRLNNNSSFENQMAAKKTLYCVFLVLLKLIHPFMPFITEEIYQMLPKKSKKALIVEDWPQTPADFDI